MTMQGVKLEAKRDAAQIEWTLKRFPAPGRVRIPLQHSTHSPAKACVQPGQKVAAGQVIAEPADSSSVFVHASIAGEVAAIELLPHPEFGESPALEIQAHPKEDKLPDFGRERTGWEETSEKELGKLFQECGLLALGHAGAPGLHTQLRAEKRRRDLTLILNGCETEPYVSTSYCLMMSHPLELLKGAELLRRAANAARIIVTVASDTLEAAEILKSKVFFLKWDHCEIRVLPLRHPQGAVPVLARTLTSGPACVYDLATAFSAYEAAAFHKPFYETVVTVGGECVVQPRTVWARHGTSFQDLIKNCKGLLREPRKVIMGGPMQGLAQLTLDVPVTKMTRAVLALPREVTPIDVVEPCIRCGRCVEVCPEEISPVMISLAAEKGLFGLAREYGAQSCIGCGNCAYVCPSKRPMTELVLLGAAGHI